MANVIQFKRGKRSTIPTLLPGEPGFATDTGELFVGTADGVIKIGDLSNYFTKSEINTLVNKKVDKVSGKGLSTNDFTAALLTKLNGIAAGAQVNTVTSVAGKTGVISLVKGDVGLGNVDNTSDANKPVSTAQAAAFALKADKTYVDAQVSSIPKFNIEVVSALPADNISTSTIYVVGNIEYIRTGSTWQKLGSFDVDITGYATAASVQAGLDTKVTKNANITAGTKTKISYDAKGLVTGGSNLTVADIPTLPSSKITKGAANLDTYLDAIQSLDTDSYVTYIDDFQRELSDKNISLYIDFGMKDSGSSASTRQHVWVDIPSATVNKAGAMSGPDKERLTNALLKTDIIDGGTW